MTLEEAIAHAQEKACGDDACAADHRQLAEWLAELRDRRALDFERQCERDERG